jgi:hypothetical protein
VDGRRVLAHASARLAWALCAVGVTLAVLGLVYGAWNYDSIDAFLGDLGPLAVLAVSFAVVGALIVSHRPRNPLGWIFCAVGLSGGLVTFGFGYGVYALLTAPGTVPGGPLAIWFGQWAWMPAAGLALTFVLLLFPDGRLPSRRWRPVAWLSAVLTALISGLLAGLLWPLRGPALLGPDAEAPLGERLAIILNVLYVLVQLLAFVCLVALLLRFRRARGVERQQLKWFLFGGAVTLAGFFASQQPGLRLLSVVLVPAIPIATAIAILRYRLYDIDLLLKRTVVYGLLTAGITVVYLAVVVGIGTLVGSRGELNLFLSIVATALIAVAFQPARERSRRLANRLVYGKRATPYEVLSDFSREMAGASTDDSLLRMARLVVEATGAVQATVWLRLGDLLQAHARWPQAEPLPEPITLGAAASSRPWP